MMITMMGRSVSRGWRGEGPLDSGLIAGGVARRGCSLGQSLPGPGPGPVPRAGSAPGGAGWGRPGPGATGRQRARPAARLLPLKLLSIFPRKIRDVFVPAGGCAPGVVALQSAVAMVLLP